MTHPPAVACASLLLLGTDVLPRDLDAVRLRKAYRRMAILTHPDTRRQKGGPDFRRVREAFDELTRYVGQIEVSRVRRGTRQPPPRTHAASAPQPPRARAVEPVIWYWKGKIPSRPLLMGEFLFYSGLIPWNLLIKAIVEQKRSRPNLGQLACRLGLLTPERLSAALRKRRQGEKLGGALVRLAVLDRPTVDRLLVEQRLLQRPLGWHIVQMGCLPMSEIPAFLGRLWRHNAAARTGG